MVTSDWKIGRTSGISAEPELPRRNGCLKHRNKSCRAQGDKGNRRRRLGRNTDMNGGSDLTGGETAILRVLCVLRFT